MQPTKLIFSIVILNTAMINILTVENYVPQDDPAVWLLTQHAALCIAYALSCDAQQN
jgi:hypothetical protein